MSPPAVTALEPLPFELVYEDGEPLENNWHYRQINLFTHLIGHAMAEQGRTDYFVGGNMFVYYSLEQARQVAREVREGAQRRAFRGPDVFWVGGVGGSPERKFWVAWEEGGRLPDVVIELLSPSTAEEDRTKKKDLYAQVFGTAEYYMYEPESQEFDGLRLSGRTYRGIVPDEKGRLWSEQLGVYLGLWHGVWERWQTDWVRLFRADGSLIPTSEERAQAAEAELARLRATLEGRAQGS